MPRKCVYYNLRSAVARRDQRGEPVWDAAFSMLRGHYAFHATACTPATTREKGAVEGAVRYLQSGFWPARRIGSLGELDEQYATWRDTVANQRRHATSRWLVAERLAEERAALRALPPIAFDPSAGRQVRVPIDGYQLGGSLPSSTPAPTVAANRRADDGRRPTATETIVIEDWEPGRSTSRVDVMARLLGWTSREGDDDLAIEQLDRQWRCTMYIGRTAPSS